MARVETELNSMAGDRAQSLVVLQKERSSLQQEREDVEKERREVEALIVSVTQQMSPTSCHYQEQLQSELERQGQELRRNRRELEEKQRLLQTKAELVDVRLDALREDRERFDHERSEFERQRQELLKTTTEQAKEKEKEMQELRSMVSCLSSKNENMERDMRAISEEMAQMRPVLSHAKRTPGVSAPKGPRCWLSWPCFVAAESESESEASPKLWLKKP